MHLTETKNTGSFQGTNANSTFFLHSILNDDVMARTQKLGVSLGCSDNEIVETIKEIKRTNFNRTMILLTKNIDEKTDNTVDNNKSNIDHAHLLSNDLQEEEFEIDTKDILNLTLVKIKKSGRLKKYFSPNQL
jgi:hypothetical protein